MELSAQGVEPHCIHCSAPLVPTDDAFLGKFVKILCPKCRKVPGIRQLYRRRVGWTASWELHLRLLTGRARHKEPLFQAQDPPPELKLPFKRRRKQK